MLLGLIVRATKDVDVVARLDKDRLVPADPLPVALADAVAAVADDLGLAENWLNPGPAALLDFGLPDGFVDRCVRRSFGGLEARIASRYDQIHFKLYAATDQGPRSKHVGDLRQLSPKREELLAAARWCRTHDPSEGFLLMLLRTLALLGTEVAREDA